MRGLDIRVMLAQAKITALCNPEEAQELYCDVLYEAMAQGVRDARANIDQVPLLFKGEELLESRWHDGYMTELLRQDMDDCPSCNDGTGNPCPFHG
ncbi:hypothetical protein GCM10027277_25700 [Pseudoduganella ginsengisoli]|uniref:Uncharacterized protein n=1 Tax=Pseudoduganella ginsengisoli TaxID=1462440 RepID=A0A6L6Q0E0_9BURK|nr:hypothetical protein [Pseudoduganella ginsengisoli]MTW02708.1 hypothetical protein [Pseudoduganella ginsengisoli]